MLIRQYELKIESSKSQRESTVRESEEVKRELCTKKSCNHRKRAPRQRKQEKCWEHNIQQRVTERKHGGKNYSHRKSTESHRRDILWKIAVTVREHRQLHQTNWPWKDTITHKKRPWEHMWKSRDSKEMDIQCHIQIRINYKKINNNFKMKPMQKYATLYME